MPRAATFPRLVGIRFFAVLLATMLAMAAAAAPPARAQGVEHPNAGIGYPEWSGSETPVPELPAPPTVGGQLAAVFDADVAAGAGDGTGDDFWIDEMLARTGTAGGFGDTNNWLFSRGRAAYMYTHRPATIGFGGSAAYWDELGVDNAYAITVGVDGQDVAMTEVTAQRKQTPSYWTSTFTNDAQGLRLVETKYITDNNVAVTGLELSSTDGTARTVRLRATSPLARTVAGDELTGTRITKNRITTLYPRLSGDGMTAADGALTSMVDVPADGSVTTKVQLGYVTDEIPASRTDYDEYRALSPADAYTRHVTAYNQWWVDNIPYLDTPEDNIDKTLFYRWWLLRFNFLDADVPGNDYQFPTAMEGVLGYNNAIVLTTGMFIDDLKYFRDPIYSYGSWVSAGEAARSGRMMDNPGEPANWSNSYTEYISEAAWRSYQLHGGPTPIAENLATYARNDVEGLIEDFDSNDNHLIEYDWGAMTGNDADAVSFDWAREHGHTNMDRAENAYVYSNAMAAAQGYRTAGMDAEADEMEAFAAQVKDAVMSTLWNAEDNLLEHRQAGGDRLLVDWKEINNYYPFSVGLVPQPGDADYDDDYVEALRLWEDADEYPIFPFYTANQADAAERGNGGSNNFSIINSTVTFRMMSSVLRDYPTDYLDSESYKKLLYWNAWAHYIDGDNRLPDQNEFWNSATANTDWGDTQDIGYRSWIHHTILGTTNFTMIEDAMGLRPRSDARIELDPIDIDWPYFTADNIRYRDADLSVVWDEPGDGERPYGESVPEGYSAFLDGELAFTADSLGRVVYDPATGTIVDKDDDVTILAVNAGSLQAPQDVTFAADTRVVDLFAKAGADIDPATTGTTNLAEGAAVEASFTADDSWSDASGAVDGTTINEPFWGTAGSPNDQDSIEVDLGEARAVDDVRVYFYRTSSSDNPQGGRVAGTRQGYAAPSMYVVEYLDGDTWRPVQGQAKSPTYPRGNYNHVQFPEVDAQRLRVTVTHAPGFRTGIKEVQVRHTGVEAPAATNAPPSVSARIDDGYAQAGSARVIGTVRDDGLPTGDLDAAWTVVDQPEGSTALFEDASSATTVVRFSQGGTYTLRLTATDGTESASADLVVEATGAEEGSTNVAPAADPSASYTAGWNNVDAVNDGEGRNSGGDQAALWGTWSGNRPSSQWLQYTWDSPVRVNGSEIMFWTDSAAGSGDGVAVPDSWVIQSRDPDGNWVDVPGADQYGTARQGTNVTSFDAVTTTALRATFQTAPNAAGTSWSAVGVAEWQVFADRPVAVDDWHVRTTVGELPDLPATIGVTYADGSRSSAPVAWPDVSPEQVANEGDFTLTGIVSGTALPATLTVWVRSSPPGQINTIDAVEATTHVGVAPSLPDRVAVQYNDGSREMLAVTWDAVEAEQFAQPGTFQVEGSVEGAGTTTATAVVTVVEVVVPDTVAPTVTIAVDGQDLGADRYVGVVDVAVTATDDDSGVDTVEVAVDGGDWEPYTGPLAVDTPGDHTVAARATDVAGNTSAVRQAAFTVVEDESVAPTVAIEVGDGDVWAGGQQVTVVADDDGSGVERVELSLDGGDWVAYSAPVTVNRVGSHTAVARATDVLGNTSEEATAAFEVAEDPDAPEPAGNPIVRDPYTSDPSALVSGDRLYLYTGHDEAPPGQQSWTMDDWQVFSTDEVVKDPSAWTHHGERLSLEDFDWANADAWAGEVEERDGTYYWYVPVDGAGEGWHDIGVAVGDSPTGPFTDALGEPLISDGDLVDAGFDTGNNIDPTVFVDDDGQAWMYWGSFWAPRMVQLGDDMTSVQGEITEPEGLDEFWEAPYLFEREGTYYMAYASNANIDDDGCVTASTFACIRYATADSPAGPWTHQGILLGQVSSTTNHPAVVEFDGQWWMVYHTADAEGGGNFRRSVAIDEVEFNDDGTIQQVVQTPVVEYVPPITDNIGLFAQPSASYTAPFSSLGALNDDEVPPEGNAFWTTWPDDQEPDVDDWVQYDWAHEVLVDQVDLWFMQDVADDASGGVKVPSSYEVQYRDGEEWLPVPGADGLATERDAFNTTTFDPVVTDALRVVMVNSQPDVASGVGVYEWQVHHVQPESIAPVTVTTPAGTAPELPTTVDVTYPGGVELAMPVTWLDVADVDLSTAGESTLDGVVPGSLATATATVVVEAADPLSLDVALDPAEPDGAAGWYVSAVTVTATTNDDATVEFSVDGPGGDGDWVADDDGVMVVDADGSHTVQVRAVRGDEVSDVQTFALDVDTTDPDVVVDGVVDGATWGDSRVVDLSVSATDDTSGLARLRVFLDGTRVDDGATSWEAQWGLWDLDLGEHLLRVVAVDVAGNRRVTRVTFTVGTSIGDVLTNLERFEEADLLSRPEGRQVRNAVLTAERMLDRGRTDQAVRHLQRALDMARGIDDVDARRVLVRDLAELLRHLEGDGEVPNTAADAARNARALGDGAPAMVDRSEVFPGR